MASHNQQKRNSSHVVSSSITINKQANKQTNKQTNKLTNKQTNKKYMNNFYLSLLPLIRKSLKPSKFWLQVSGMRGALSSFYRLFKVLNSRRFQGYAF